MSKISELSDGGSLISSDYLIAVRSGGNVKVRMDQINVDQVDLGDNEFIRLGNSQDLTMVHTSTESIINQAGIGDLLLQRAGATKLTINASGIDVTGAGTFSGAGSFNTTANDAVTANSSFATSTTLGLVTLKRGGVVKGYLGLSPTEAGAALLDSAGAVRIEANATGIDVTGSVTADGLTVKNPNVSGEQTILKIENAVNTGTIGKITFNQTDDRMGISNESSGSLSFDTATLERLNIASNGDISFYEDTGTTPKFVWDASAEALGIGTASPAALIHGMSGDLFLTANSTAADSGQGVFFQSTTSGWATSAAHAAIYGKRTDASNGYLRFDTRQSGTTQEAMRIDSAGNVDLYQGNNLTWRFAAGSTIRGSISVDSADNITFSNTSSNTERMRIDASGNVGIGVVPNYPLDVQSGTADSNIAHFTGANSTRGLTISTYTADTFADAGVDLYGLRELRFSTNVSEAMLIDSSGNVGIGTSTVSAPLHIKSSTGNAIFLQENGSPTTGTGQVGRFVSTTSNVTDAIDSNGYYRIGGSTNPATGAGFSEYMRIDASGNLLVGKTSDVNTANGITLRPDGGARFTSAGTGSFVQLAFFRNGSAGEVGSISTTSSGTSYVTSSDQRLKENIADADDAGSKIDAIQVRKFDWKVDGSHQDYGMVAQELLEVAPEAVSAPEDPEEMMGVDYSKLVPVMLKEIQSLRARINALEAE